MKKFLSFGAFIVLSFLTIFGCKSELTDGSSSSGESQSSAGESQGAVEYGSIVINDGSGNNGYRAIDYSELKTAKVSVICPDKTVVDGGTIALSNGTGTTSINNIPAGKNRVVKVVSDDTGATLYAVCDVTAGTSSSVTVNWDSTALGAVYYNLIQNGTDVSSFGDTEKAAIKAKIPSVHSSLVNSAQIASDYPSMNGSYVLECGTVEISTTGLSGGTVQVTDIVSSSVSVTSDSQASSLSANPGTWKVKAVKGSETKTASITVVAGATTKVSVSFSEAVTDRIVVKVPASYGYVNMYVWDTSDSSINKTHISLTESDGYYTGTINVTASKIILTKKAGAWDSQTGDLSISEAGIWVYNGSSFDKTSGDGLVITVENPIVPEKASVTLPSAGLSLEGTFNVTVTSNCDVTSGSISINGTTKTLSIGTNTLNVADFVSADGTYSVSGSVTNKAGTTDFSGSIVVKSVVIPSSFDELRIYQVMVASFIDGDTTIGYSQMYGPNSARKNGDLQGVIDAIPYIKSLGCNAIWMTPIFDSNYSSDTEKLDATGYFAYDYFNVDPKFGSNEKFAELVSKAHANGIAIILDGVFGHHKSTGVKNSPNGKNTSSRYDSNGNKYTDYTQGDTLEFYKEVAAYWIKNYKIDGWRFDQDYQVGPNYQDGHNYWSDIRSTVEAAAASNGTKGKAWGTLGFMVGEDWQRDDSSIQSNTVRDGGLNSTFDFPARYKLVDCLAEEEWNDYTITIGDALGNYLYKSGSDRNMSSGNGTFMFTAFLSNHDTFRFGDLVNIKHGKTVSDSYYRGLHKIALASLAAYSGPYVIYYGDEWGAMVGNLKSPMDVGSSTPVGDGAYYENASRSSGKISGFSSDEQEIIDWTTSLNNMRENYPIISKGTTSNLYQGEYYVGQKTYNGQTAKFIINNTSSSVSYDFGGSGKNMMTGASTTSTVSCDAYSAIFVLLD